MALRTDRTVFVEVEGQKFRILKNEDAGQWDIFRGREPSPGEPGQFGTLVWREVPGATETTGLADGDASAHDGDLVRRIAEAAGFTMHEKEGQ
jgi:hypothetical protein